MLLPVLLHVVMLRLWSCEEKREAGRVRRKMIVHSRLNYCVDLEH